MAVGSRRFASAAIGEEKRNPANQGNSGMKFAVLTVALLALGTHPSAFGQAAPSKPDLAKAKQTATTVCAACHGADGNSANPANPTLAGQHADYLTLQLMHFKSGVRSNQIMAGMVANLSPEDMRALGVYFSQQTPKAGAAKDPALVAAGQKLFRGGNAATGLPA